MCSVCIVLYIMYVHLIFVKVVYQGGVEPENTPYLLNLWAHDDMNVENIAHNASFCDLNAFNSEIEIL